MLGGVAVPHDDSPIAAADAMRLPVHQAPVYGGEARHPAAIVGAALSHQLELFPGESVAHEHRHHVVEAETRAPFAHRVRGEILRLRHPELGGGALGQPRGEARVVGMMVRDDEAPDRAPRDATRSEEHTSELQSLRHLVCRLLLEKKKNKKDTWSVNQTSRMTA